MTDRTKPIRFTDEELSAIIDTLGRAEGEGRFVGHDEIEQAVFESALDKAFKILGRRCSANISRAVRAGRL